MKKRLPLVFTLVIIAIFLAYKLPGVTYRFGDGNAYLYMAKMLLGGHLPYKSFFLADPPFLVIFLTPFYALFRNHLLGFQVLPIVIEAATAFLLYLVAKKRGEILSFLAPLFFLFSFTVLATSDYLTGIQLTVFLIVLGLALAQYNKPILSGVAWALAILTKLYAIPVYVGFLIYKVLPFDKTQDKKILIRIFLGTLVAGIVVMLPFLIPALGDVWNYMVVHQLHRPPGLDKWHIWTFFLGKEWFLLVFGIIGLCIKNNRDLVASFVLTAAFFLVFPDLYYLYLETLLPFIVLGSVTALSRVFENREVRAALIPVAVLYLVFFAQSFFVYKSDFYTVGRFLNADAVAAAVEKLPPGPLYGSHEVAPLVALLSGRTLAGNYIDTNTQAFASGGEDLLKASQTAVDEGAYLIGRVTDLPQYGIKDFGMNGYFDKSLFKYCRQAAKLPSTSGEQDNFIGVYKCSANSL